ncbi:MAG TPA: enoyl-[acyl-carrier-protein] reductase FabK [Dehalococcoidia bacterium]|nr:enoyl-[acyl-carrier-protein] reductase FabK [Dehalococcoidia bacterium]
MLKTAVCDLFGIKHPVIQGGMAHLGTAELVSAVSNAGGLGIIGTGFYEPDWVRNQIHRTREKTSNPFGINIQLRSPHIEPVTRIILEEKVPIVTTGAGDPAKYMPEFKRVGIKVIPVIASVGAAKHVQELGADAIVAEGMESAGHIGETTTMALVPQVVDSIQIPVIAAGGIADGRGLVAALALGAKAVQIGTRFACSEECIAHLRYKEKILEADDHATVITGRTTKLPLRSLKNSLTEQFLALEEGGATPEELNLFGQGRMYLGLIEGDIDDGSLLAGQIAGLIKEIKPIRAIIEEIIAEAEAIIAELKKQTGS